MKIFVKHALLMMLFVVAFYATSTPHAGAVDIISTIAGNGTRGFSGDGELGANASINGPRGIYIDSVGNIFFADNGNGRIRKVDETTGIITTVAGNGMLGDSGDGVLATDASLGGAVDVFVDSTGNIFVADGRTRVYKVEGATGIITTVAGNGLQALSKDGGLATNSSVAQPRSVFVDSAGNIFIASFANESLIRRVDGTTGIITTVAGSGPVGFGIDGQLGSFSGDGGLATDARINSPKDVFADSAGNLFIADYKNDRIRKVDASTGIITTVAGNGTSGFSGDGGIATSAQLDRPIGVSVDNAGNIFIAEEGNNRIRKVHSALPPTITSIVPDTAVPGESLTITFTGTNFTLNMTVNISGTGVTASNVIMNSNTLTLATATFTIDVNATLGVRTISIAALGGTSNTINFNINTTTIPPTTTLTTSTTIITEPTTTTTNRTTTTTLPLNTGEVWQIDNHFINIVNGKPQDTVDTGVVTVTTILVGDTVKWTNKGTTEHTTTNDDDSVNGIFAGELWDSGNMGVGETFSHTFDKKGEFPYFCKTHGRDDMAGTIVVKSSIAGTAPIANFIADQPLGIVPLTVRFTDISTGNPTPTEWLWDFGDGGASIEPNPSHVYSIPDLYSVTLTVKNSLGEDSLTKTDFIKAQSFFDKSFTFNCDQNMKTGFFGLHRITMNVGDVENCTLKLTNHKQGQTKEVDMQMLNWFWSGIKIEPARSVTDENGELRITITAVKKGTDWAAWAVPNDKGQFQFNKKTYDIGLAWGMFVNVK